MDPGTVDILCQCVSSESTQQNGILFLSKGGTGTKRHRVHNRWQLQDAHSPLPCGWPYHSPCSLMWDAPAGIPGLWLHSVVCSCCVHIPLWLPVLEEEQKPHMPTPKQDALLWCHLSTPEPCLWTLIVSDTLIFKSYVQNDAIHVLWTEQTGWLISGWTALMVTHHT